MANAWDPAQYNKFRQQRAEAFRELTSLVRPRPAMRVIDLGCGTGELTAIAAAELPDAHVVGVDSSPAMLSQATPRAHDRLVFRLGDIAAIADYSEYDLVLSNAALHWVPRQAEVVGAMLATLPPGAQVAVQVPKNGQHASHLVAAALAAEEPFASLLGHYVHKSEALTAERYAELLHAHGFRALSVFEKIHTHELDHAGDVVEWVKGSLLLPYLDRLAAPADQERFVAAYRARLLAAVGDRAPYLFTFRRLYFWGEKS